MSRQNFTVSNTKETVFMNTNIIAWVETWDELDDNDKLVKRSQVVCHLSREGYFLNVGECSNGDKFRGVNHAIEEGEKHIQVTHHYGWCKNR